MDIDECAYQDLNTCVGGIGADGVDVDISGLDDGHTDPHSWVSLGDSESDGYSQALEFSLRSEYLGVELYFYECDDPAACSNYYKLRFGAANAIVWFENNQVKEYISGSTVYQHLPNGEDLISYRVYFNFSEGSLSMGLHHSATMQTILTYTDTSDLVPVKWMNLRSQEPESKYSYQIRRIRNPTMEQERCINTVGSFHCVSQSEEYLGLGWGGESPTGLRAEFTVLTAGETTCVDHNIPNLAGRKAPMVATLGNWLYVCGGDLTNTCMKLDMNAESPDH